MDDHGNATETKAMSQETDRNAQDPIRDWELLFLGFLLFGLVPTGVAACPSSGQ